MVEELKLAIKIDDETIEKSLLKQFANAEKMADKVVLDFKNVNFDDKSIENKFKELQKKAGQNPIDLTINNDTLEMLNQIDAKLTEIFNIGKSSFIDSSTTISEIGKIVDSVEKLNSVLDKSFDTKSKTEAYKQLKDSFKNFDNNIDLLDGFDKAGVEAAYSFWKSYEEALNKNIAESRLEEFGDSKYNKNALSEGIIDDYKNILLDYKQIEFEIAKSNNGILPAFDEDIIKNINNYAYALYRIREAEKDINFINSFPQKDEYNLESIANDNSVIEFYKSEAEFRRDWILEQVKSQKVLQDELSQTREEVEKTSEVLNKTSSESNNNSQIDELKSDIEQVKTELGEVKEKISSIDTEGFENVRSDVEKTKESVKELNDELTEMKSNISSTPQVESNISLGDSSTASAVDKVKVKLDNSVISAKELDKALDGINIPTNGFDDVLSKLDRTKSELVDIVKITKSWVADSKGVAHEAYTLKDSRGSSEIYGISSKTDKGQILRQNIVQYDASSISKAKSEQDKLTEAMAKGREQSEKVRQAEEKRQELAQNNAINKALEEEYKERQKLAEATEKEIQKNKELALSYTESASKKLSDAISKYSYGDTSDATSMMKQMNRGLSNFGDFSNIKGNINNFDSIIQNIISDLKRSHEEVLKAINEEIKAESQLQNQKDSFYKSNLSAIDLEIKKREEEAKAFSNSLKAQMEAQQKAESQLQSYDTRLESYNKKTSGYDATIKRFDDGGWTSDAYLKNVQAVKDAVEEYEKILNNLKNHPELVTEEELNKLAEKEKLIKENITVVQNMSAAEKGYTLLSGQKAMDKINGILKENSAMSREAKAQIRAWYNEIASGNPKKNLTQILGEVQKIVNAEADAGRAGKSMMDSIKEKAWYGVASAIGTYFGLNDVFRYIGEGIDTIRDLDEAMTEVRKVSEATESQYESFQNTVSATAKEIASTNKELLNSSADFLRLGYSLDQAESLAKNATLFVNVGDGVDITEATEDMITAMKAFDIKAEDSIKIVDDYNQIGNKFALSATDIGEAMKRSASALETGNNSFEESIALITAMNEIVQSSENTGNTLKVFSLRLRGAKAELEDMGEDTDGLCESSSKLREQLKALTGVDIMLDDNTFKSTTQIVKELGAAWDKLSDSSQAATLELVAGKTRANNVAALLKNYKQIDNVLESLGDAEGSALRENDAIVDSINGRIKILSASMENFWQTAIDDSVIKNGVSGLTSLVNGVTKLVDTFGLLPPILTTVGAALSFKNIGKCYVSA